MRRRLLASSPAKEEGRVIWIGGQAADGNAEESLRWQRKVCLLSFPFRSPSIATTDEPQLFLTVFRRTGLRR